MEERGLLTLPTRSERSDSCHWSEDNQIALVTSKYIFIQEPVITGAYADRSIQYIKSEIEATTLSGLSAPDELERAISEDIAQPQSLVDEGFRAAVWSPSGASPCKGCLIAAISHCHRAVIYDVSRKSSRPYWRLVKDLGKLLEAVYPSHSDSEKRRVISLAWSPIIGATEAHVFGSIIALGARDGSVTLIGHARSQRTQILGTIEAGNSWITSISFSHWHERGDDQNTVFAYLATSDSTGEVKVFNISLHYVEDELAMTTEVVTFYQGDQRLITCLRWQDTREIGSSNPASDISITLAVAKGNSILLWTADSASQLGWAEQLLSFSTGIAGLTWSKNGRTLNALGFAGEFSSFEPRNMTKEAESNGTKLISEQIRAKFLGKPRIARPEIKEEEMAGNENNNVNGETEPLRDVPRCWGLAMSCSDLFMAFTFYLLKPQNITYRIPKQEIMQLGINICAFRHDQKTETDMSQRIVSLLETYHDFFQWYNPTYALWDVLSYMDFDKSQESSERVLINLFDALESVYTRHGVSAQIDMYTDELEGISVLRTTEYANIGVNACRLIMFIERNLQYANLAPSFRAHINATFTILERVIYEHHITSLLLYVVPKLAQIPSLNVDTLRTVLLICDIGMMNYADKPQLMAIIHSTLLQVKQVCAKTNFVDEHKLLLDIDANLEFTSGVEATERSLSPKESCPACGGSVNLMSTLKGLCNKGHSWDRCLLTFKILRMPKLRSCLGCRRKALAIETHPRDEHDIVRGILETCDICIICGGRFAEKGL